MTAGFLVMLLALLLAVVAAIAFVTVLYSIHAEERHMSLTQSPQTRTSASTRRLLGVTVRAHTDETPERHSLTR